MKAMILLFLVALVCTGLFGPQSMPAYPTKAGVLNVQESAPGGVKRDDFVMPEVKVIDGYRPVMYQATVVDTGERQMIDFPMGTTNQ